jgi:hypothetical protein
MALAGATQLRSTPPEGGSVLGLIISAIVVGLIIQVALAAAGVALIAGRYAPGRRRI